MSFRKISWKMFFIKFIFSEVFFLSFLSSQIGNFYRTIKKNFHECIFFRRKESTLQNVSLNSTLVLYTPTDNNVIQSIFFKNTFLKRNRCKKCFLFPSSFFCNRIENAYQTKQKFLNEEFFCEKLLWKTIFPF